MAWGTYPCSASHCLLLLALVGTLATSVAAEDVLVYPEGEPRAGERIEPVIEEPITAPHIVEAAEWAVAHLADMSDSGVYTSLTLHTILDAATQLGVYHNNTLLTVELASPHLLDNVETSVHKIIVMRDQEDGVRSFAIDEFPVMEPAAIEEYWIRKVEAHRVKRVQELAALDREYEEHFDSICAEDIERRGGEDQLERGEQGVRGEDEAAGGPGKESAVRVPPPDEAEDVAAVVAGYAREHAHVIAPIGVTFVPARARPR